jgi:hypothetical protein
VSAALGGLAGGVGAAARGLPRVFLIPAAFRVMAVLGLAAMTRTWAKGLQRRLGRPRLIQRRVPPAAKARWRTTAPNTGDHRGGA